MGKAHAGAWLAAAWLGLLGLANLWGQEAQVIILSPHNESIRVEFGRAFSRWHEERHHQPARVEWRDVGGTTDALKFVQSEFSRKTNGIGIDLFFGGGLEPYLLLADKRLSSAYQPPADILEGIPLTAAGIEIYDRNFTWYAAALSSFGILQNTRVQRLTKLPLARKWEDLADPHLYGWVGAGDPRNSGTMNTMFEAFLQAYGWEKGWDILARIGGNVRKFDRISSTTAKDVTLGETAYAFAIDFYGFTQIAMAGRTNMTFVLPTDFTAINPDCISILKGAPHLETAQRFINFLLSEDGQRLWFLPKGHPQGARQHSIERMSIRPDFYRRYQGVSNVEFSPFDLPQNFRYDNSLARKRRDVMAALVGTLLVDTHPELKLAWQAIIRRGRPAAEVADLGRVPVTAEEALQLAAGPWKEAAFRNTKQIEWQNWAQQKYRRLTRGDAPPATHQP
jgi:ABC-type Fe3+ transport system substrate-binding protein